MNRYLTRWQLPSRAKFKTNCLIKLRGGCFTRSGYGRVGAIVLLSALTIGLIHPQAHSQSENSTPTSSPTATESGTRPILQLGSQGDAVTELQSVLKLLGYYSGAIDGLYQESTAQAVASFQQAAGLQPDGIVGTETWNRLLPAAPPLSQTAAIAPTTPAESGSAATVSPSTAFPAPAATPTPATPAPTPSPSPARSSFPSPTATTTPTPATPSPTPIPVTPSPTPTTSTTPGYTPVAPTPAPSPATASASDLPVLRMGMQGADVTRLQERLKALGLFSGTVDGVFGAETQAAVQEAQRNYNLEPDGVVGPATWAALLQDR